MSWLQWRQAPEQQPLQLTAANNQLTLHSSRGLHQPTIIKIFLLSFSFTFTKYFMNLLLFWSRFKYFHKLKSSLKTLPPLAFRKKFHLFDKV